MTVLRGCLLLFLFWFTACSGPPDLPTLVPTADRAAMLPATFTPDAISAEETITLTPTNTLTPSSTAVVSSVNPTSVVGPGINITSPNPGSEFLLGSEVIVSGLIQLGDVNKLSVILVSATGTQLAEADAQVNDFNSWQVTISIPPLFSGPAEIRASVIDPNDQVVATDSIPVNLVVDTSISERFLDLYRPNIGYQAVAGFYLFFDGRAQLPANNLITISIWNEECQDQVATQSYQLRGSGYWQGFVLVPANVEGLACAVAQFGEAGTEEWREALEIIEILPATDDRAMAVLVGNPPPNVTLSPGKSLLLYGTAYNAPQDTVLLSILLENGRLINEGTATTDNFGYWEQELFIPADASGPAQIFARIGEQGTDEFAETTVNVTIGAE